MSLGDSDASIMAKIEIANLNHVILSDQEIHRCRELLYDDERILSKIDLELRAVLERREKQQERVNKFRVVLAPYKRVPPEILLKIFFLSLPDYANVWADSSTIYSMGMPPVLSDAPWLLGQVCAAWRNISRGEPRLWGRVFMDVDDKIGIQRLVRACEVLPPHVTLSVAHMNAGYCQFRLPDILRNMWRIQELNLNMIPASFDDFWTNLSPESFATIRSVGLNIVHNDEEPRDRNWGEAKPFHLASNLRKLTLRSLKDYSSALFSLDIPWSQLTSIHLDLTVRDVLRVLQKCSSIENATLSFKDNYMTGLERSPHMPRLHSLCMSSESPLPYSIVRENSFWEHLTILNLLDVNFEDGKMLFNILEQCTRLTELITAVPPVATSGSIDHVLNWPHLAVLILFRIQDPWLFPTLMTPGLTKLRVELPGPGSYTYPVRDMIIACKPPLHSLTIDWNTDFLMHGSQDTCPGLHDLLTILPRLVKLYITSKLVVEDKILEEIGEGSLLPRLTTFRCSPVSLEAFANMVERRVEREYQQRRLAFYDLVASSRYARHNQDVKLATASRLEAIGRMYGINCKLNY